MPDTTSAVERFTVRSGVRIRYLDNSPEHPSGLPILLSPGFTDFADEYIDVLQFFGPRRFWWSRSAGAAAARHRPPGTHPPTTLATYEQCSKRKASTGST